MHVPESPVSVSTRLPDQSTVLQPADEFWYHKTVIYEPSLEATSTWHTYVTSLESETP